MQGLDDGLPAERGDDPAARRGAVRPQVDHEPAARQELAHLHLCRFRPPREAALARAPRRARPRRRRPRGDVRLEPPRAHGGLPRRSDRRLRHPHAQPAAPPRRPHVHRDACRRSRPDRRQDAVATRRGVPGPGRVRARDRGRRGRDAARRDRVRGSDRDRRRRGIHLPGHRRALGGGDVLHERHHGAAQGRRLLAPGDRDPLARLDAVELARHRRARRRAAGGADVPRQRLGLPLHVHARRRGRRSSPARTSIPPSLLDAFVEQKVTVTAGVPTIWMGILQLLDAAAGRVGPLAPAVDDRRRRRRARSR